MTIAFAVALSVFNAVTLTPALSALLLERESHHKGRFFSFFEKIIGGGTRGLRRRAAPRRRRAMGGRAALRRRPRADLLGLPHRAAGLRAGRGPGLLSDSGAGPRRGVARLHRHRRPAGREDHHVGSRRAGAVLGHGVQLQRRRAESGVDVRAAEAIRGSAGGGALGPDRPRPARRAALQPARRDRGRVLAALHPGTEPVRRLRVPDSRSDRTGHLQPGERHPEDRRGGQPVRGRPRAVQPVHGERSAAAGDDQPAARARARPAAQRDQQRDADSAGLAVRQRFRVQQPRVSRVRPGRAAVPLESAGAAPALRAHDAAATWCRSSRS